MSDHVNDAVSRLRAWIRDYAHIKQPAFIADLTAVLDSLEAMRVWGAVVRRHAEEGLDNRAFFAEDKAGTPGALSGTLALREIGRMRQSLHAIVGAVIVHEEAGQ